ncbi:uncharacterized protein LOC127286751 [Leptopilina boulardi]|uniref:uncharacterized protein LOC127286751 n=1 Tax=Leptopilina boulardi TaxID=63433 RepID=UPI0021F5EED1|nr:uncharacterized protein LOC127286751 [Leptopilina boulardi]
MTLIQKTLLLFLVIYYFHGNHALKLQGSAEYLRDDLNLPIEFIEKIENAFIHEFKQAIKRNQIKFEIKSKYCHFSQPEEKFEEFIGRYKKSVEHTCRVQTKLRKWFHFKSPCYSNLKMLFKKYADMLIFQEFLTCSNSIKSNNMEIRPNKLQMRLRRLFAKKNERVPSE